jgi:hypothetical protein
MQTLGLKKCSKLIEDKLNFSDDNFFLKLNAFWNFCVLSILFFNLRVFPISYKYKYVLFDLNMLRLFQEINTFYFSEIKLVFNKNLP